MDRYQETGTDHPLSRHNGAPKPGCLFVLLSFALVLLIMYAVAL